MTKVPTWNLSELYSGAGDPRAFRVLAASLRKARSFAKRYRGKVAKHAKSLKAFLALLQDYESLLQGAAKPVHYASLIFTEDSLDQARGAFLQKVRADHKKFSQELIFLELEIVALPAAKLKSLIRAPVFSRYAHYLSQLLDSKPHRLSESEEKILSDKELTGHGAFVRLFAEEHAAKEYRLVSRSGKRFTESEVLDLLHAPDRRKRCDAALALSSGLHEEARRLTFITNTLALDKSQDDSRRCYESAEASRHLDNEIDQSMVDAMSAAVVRGYPLVRRYYEFKKKIMGLKVLYDYDRYAPISHSRANIPFPAAKKMVLNAFQRFSPEYCGIARRFFDEDWIDARPRKGKRGGAYCSFVTPDHHPYVFLNYFGGLREVFTLAHELGHAVHAYLMREVGYLSFSTPLTVAETASVFAEMLLFDYLREETKSANTLFDLYIKKIESVFATVFRQVSMYKFEQDLHLAVRKKGELSSTEINSIWRKRQEEMFGSALSLTPGYDHWWSYIPHFIHTPFYVYAYAFGELLTLSLYARYKQEGRKFAAKYMAMLAAGGSKSPKELLAPFGINLRRADFWSEGISLIRGMVQEAEELYRKV